MANRNGTTVKICFVSTKAEKLFRPDAKTNFGGSEVQQFLLAEKLSQKHKIYFILASEKKLNHKSIKVISAFQLKGGIFTKLSSAFKLYRAIKSIAPDIIIQRAHGPETFICSLYSRLNKKRFIYSIASQADIDGTWTRGGSGLIFKLGIEGADLLISQGKGMTKIAKKHNLPKHGLIKKIPKAIKIEPLQYKKESILWIGRCIKMKRPELFLRLANSNPGLKFTMVCPQGNDQRLTNDIENRAKKIKNLTFRNYCSPQEIQILHAKAKLFVLTSLWEGDLPMVVLESLVQKNPILTMSYDPENKIASNKIGLNANNSFSKLNHQLQIILKNHSEFSQHAFKFVKKYHDVNVINNQWEKIIGLLNVKS